MKTYSQIVDEVLSYLRSYVRDQELSTHLTASIAAGDVSIPVDDATAMTRGRIQIGDELIWVDRSDRATRTAVVPPYGRGMDGTTAEFHSAGERVVIAPLYPRKTVADLVNSSIATIGASLFGVKSVTITPFRTQYIYELPADVQEILSVQVIDTSTYLQATHLSDWQLYRDPPAGISTTGKALFLRSAAFTSPSQIIVTYTCEPVQFTSPSQTFDVTLLPASSQDVLVLLTASRLLATAESYNLQTRAVEANTMDSKVQPGQGLSQSKYLYALYQQRLGEERLRLLTSVPQRFNYIR